jgi:hypothetical protein
MPTTVLWAPNQGFVAQKKRATFTAPSGVGNWYMATLNGKTVRYVSVSGDTAITAATGLYNLLVASEIAEIGEITWTNPSDAVVDAEASEAGVPFADVPGTDAGLVFSTGNGLANGITTATVRDNASPSDANDAQNWLRVTPPAAGVRQLPQNGDDMVVANTDVPILWNLDQLAAVQLNSYTRYQSMTGAIGLPVVNPNGYTEWRATYFKFSGRLHRVASDVLQVQRSHWFRPGRRSPGDPRVRRRPRPRT